MSKDKWVVWSLIAAFVSFIVVNIVIEKGITGFIMIRMFIFAVATVVVVTLHKKGKFR